MCNVQNVCQLEESAARAVAGGKWKIRG